jgi:class 3 adenylate cyclase
MTPVEQAISGQSPFDRFTRAAAGRVGLTLAASLYVGFRFGGHAGLRVLPAVLGILLLEGVRMRHQAQSVRATALECAAAALQPVIVLAVCFIPAPFGFGSDVPGPLMLDSQAFILVLCFLASNADAANPGPLWSSGAAIVIAWLGVRQVILSEPHVMTASNIHMSNYRTPLAFLQAIHGPTFFNLTMWQGSLVSTIMITAALGFGVYRSRRLARMAAEAAFRREELAAFFSRPVADAILKARDSSSMPPELTVAALDCDLVGFTALAESASPGDVAAILRAWRSVVEDAVFAEGRAILSHTGDGVVALFGFAGAYEDCVRRALAAAQRILHQWPPRTQAFGAQPRPAIGIDFGPVRLGVMGTRLLSFLAVGPVLERAEALQRETRDAGAPVLVGSLAVEKLGPDARQVRDLFVPYAKGDLRAWLLRETEAD